MKNNVAFIGLGVMGYPMAGHLSRNGYPTRVYNRTTRKAYDWAKNYHGEVCSSPGDAARDCDLVFVCVGNDDDVRSVVYGETGLINNMKLGSVLVDHTTTSAELAKELGVACKQKGIAFIDAPVSGGQAGAENGALTIMCGGQSDVYDKAAPVMSVYGKQSKLMGENGQGQRAKMVNQICIAGVLKGLSEGLTLAKRSGLDIDDLVDVLKHGAAGSWQMENRSSTMARDKFDFGFAIDWMRKDLGICIDEGKRLDIGLPLTMKVDDEYRELQNSGYGRMDTSVLIRTYQKSS